MIEYNHPLRRRNKSDINWIGKTVKEVYNCSVDDMLIEFTDGSIYSFYFSRYPDGTTRTMVIDEDKICGYCKELEFE